MNSSQATVLAAALTLSTFAVAEESWIRCGGLVDVADGRTLGPHTVIVNGDRFSELRAGHPQLSDGATLIDLSELTCLPG
jgi:hypothetical protein